MTKLMYLLIIALFAPLCAQTEQDSSRASDRLTITMPSRDGASAACRVIVQGHLTLNPGEHALAFAARSDFANLGLTWMQGEVQLDQTTIRRSSRWELPKTWARRFVSRLESSTKRPIQNCAISSSK